jgi:hypothetical protein
MQSLPFNERLEQYKREKNSSARRLFINEKYGVLHRSGKITRLTKIILWFLKKAGAQTALIYQDTLEKK